MRSDDDEDQKISEQMALNLGLAYANMIEEACKELPVNFEEVKIGFLKWNKYGVSPIFWKI